MTGWGSAFERRDLDDWVSFYADGAWWIGYRHSSPPRSPNRMVGRRGDQA
jgi:hypothetical protein